MRSRLIKVVIISLLLVGVGFGGFYGYNTYFIKKPAAATVQYYTVSARTMNLQESVQGTGAAYAAATKDIMPNNNGTLKDLSVKVGDTVTAGQKLFVSDSDDVRRSVTTAKNNLTKQNLTLSSDLNAARVDDNKIAMDKISVSDAQYQLNEANKQLSNMTVKAPIGGVVTAVNNSNNDSVQQGKAVLTIVDMSSIKIKVSVDELDIDKVKAGQKAEIKFDAIQGKTYEGTVETVAPVGITSNNVTTYEVVVNVNEPSGIKIGMNGNVNILVNSKEGALVIPAEALIENNGQKFVRVEATDNTTSVNNSQAASSSTQTSQGNGQNRGQAGSRNNIQVSTGSNSKLIAIKTGMETQNYIEVTEGLTEGQKVLVQLPQTSTTTNTGGNRNSIGAGFGGLNGSFGGNMGGLNGNANRTRAQGGNTGSSRN